MNQQKIIASTSIIFTIVSLLVACDPNANKHSVEGFSPLYLPLNQVSVIEVLNPKPTEKAGKIFQLGNSITFQTDLNKGIHVIDCSNTSQPQKVKFIAIPGVSEIAVKGNILIANNYRDLVSIDVSNLNSIHVVGRVKDVYKANDETLPTERNVFFECIDDSKGIVIGWEKKTLDNPKCKTL
jgi:hypothetical protein